VAFGVESGSDPASAGRENEVVNGRRFSICVPAGARGSKWVVR